MIRSALVMATGVPKPAMPSSRAPKQNPITTSTMRRSLGRWRITQPWKASNRPDETVMLNSRRALNTIHMIGHRAKAAPAAALSSASGSGNFQTSTASARPTTRPASEASHAGRRSTPIRIRTATIGADATRNDRARLSDTGVSN